MKKFLAVMLALVMTLSMAAFAESTETSDTAETSEATEIDISDWVEVDLTDAGLCFFVPADMTASDPDTEAGQIWYAENADMAMSVTAMSGETSLEDVDAALADESYEVGDNDMELNYEHQSITSPDDDTYAGILVTGSDGNYYVFEINDLSGSGAYYFGAVMATLTETAAADTAESSVEG